MDFQRKQREVKMKSRQKKNKNTAKKLIKKHISQGISLFKGRKNTISPLSVTFLLIIIVIAPVKV